MGGFCVMARLQLTVDSWQKGRRAEGENRPAESTPWEEYRPTPQHLFMVRHFKFYPPSLHTGQHPATDSPCISTNSKVWQIARRKETNSRCPGPPKTAHPLKEIWPKNCTVIVAAKFHFCSGLAPKGSSQQLSGYHGGK